MSAHEKEIKFPWIKGIFLAFVFTSCRPLPFWYLCRSNTHTHKFAHQGVALGRYDKEKIRRRDKDAEITGLTLQDRPPIQIVGHRPDHTFLKLWCPEPSLKSPGETRHENMWHRSILILCLKLYLCVTGQTVFAKINYAVLIKRGKKSSARSD